jgi:hypothetical protein
MRRSQKQKAAQEAQEDAAEVEAQEERRWRRQQWDALGRQCTQEATQSRWQEGGGDVETCGSARQGAVVTAEATTEMATERDRGARY